MGSKIKDIEKKSEEYLMREYHDLLVIQSLLEKCINSKNTSDADKCKKQLLCDIKVEGRIERRFNRTLTKLESLLSELQKKNPKLHDKLMTILEQVEIYKNTLVVILGKKGDLEQLLKKNDMNKLKQDIDKAITADRALYQEIEILKKEINNSADSEDGKNILEQVKKLYERLEYRPVGVAVLYQESNGIRRYLVTQSVKNLNNWAFPQGGIEKGESLKTNLSRELNEELGLKLSRDTSDIIFAYYYEELDAEEARKDKRGFTKGKAYFYNLIRYTGNSIFHLQKDEVADAKWLTYEEALKKFEIGRPEKAELSKRALQRAIQILGK